MKKKVIATILKYQMLKPGITIVVAASGGVDSMVLLHVLSIIKNEFDLTLVVAHMDHDKRHDSALDAHLVRQTAKKYGFEYTETTLPKQKLSGNFHHYARQQRYLFLKRVAIRYKACVVATGHHANDHLETVIDRIMRGETPTSLIGIQPRGTINGISVIRPLIEITKEELLDYALNFAIDWREDLSNASDCYMRNRIRKHIVPKMRHLRWDVLMHVRNLSDNLAQDESYFSSQLDELINDVTITDVGYEMKLSWLRKLHPSLKRRLMVRLIPQISKGALLDLIDFIDEKHVSARLDVGATMVAKKKYDAFYLSNELMMSERRTPQVESYEISLRINDKVELPTGEKVFSYQGKRENFKNSKKSGAQETYLCYNKIRLPLKVRNRHPGDRVQLVNSCGHAKVSQIMIDSKIPEKKRSTWPIVVDSNDVVLWIPGLKKSPFCSEKAVSKDDILIIFQS